MSRRALLSTLSLTLVLSVAALQAEVPSESDQIAGALAAAPEDRKEGAAVIGWNADGGNVTLREGSNDLICLADDPAVDGFNAACYHKDLGAYMARGRDLKREGVKGMARSTTRFEEIEAGTLPMPDGPRALYVTTGTSFDASTGTVADAFTRWVLYVPGMTAEELGLSASPGGEGPWLMGAGTPGAHIMITPKKD